MCLRAACQGHLKPEWLSSDDTVKHFFDRLAEAMFHPAILNGPGPPAWFQRFRRQCEQRELAGRDEFGVRYLSRNNRVEGQEEASDETIYSHLDILRQRREGRPEEWELALTVAKRAAENHRDLAHRHHAPISPS
jgi:hypothetical protein